MRARSRVWGAALTTALLSACATPLTTNTGTGQIPATARPSTDRIDALRREVVITALSLLDTGYQFGGSNPEAGVDCSGLVVLVYKTAAGISLPHNAAQIAHGAHEVAVRDLQAGDLIFFNTLGRPYSHVGIYLGDDKFIHAPNSRGRVRVESLKKGYFASRLHGARSLLD